MLDWFIKICMYFILWDTLKTFSLQLGDNITEKEWNKCDIRRFRNNVIFPKIHVIYGKVNFIYHLAKGKLEWDFHIEIFYWSLSDESNSFYLVSCESSFQKKVCTHKFCTHTMFIGTHGSSFLTKPLKKRDLFARIYITFYWISKFKSPTTNDLLF